MTFYQRSLLLPTGVRGFLSCCYGNRDGRPNSPQTLPTDLPLADGQEQQQQQQQQEEKANPRLEVSPDAVDASVFDEDDASDDQAASAAKQIGSRLDAEVPRSDALPADAAAASAQRGNGWQSVGGGWLEAAARLDLAERQLAVRVVRAVDLAVAETTSSRATGAAASGRERSVSVQVSLALLPDRKQRRKTGAASVDSPQFNDSFAFAGFAASDCSSQSLRFRVYALARRRRRQLIGECVLPLASLRLSGEETSVQMPLQLRAPVSQQDSEASESCSGSTLAGSLCSLGVAPQPELLLGAAYNARTGQLLLEIIKASCLQVAGAAKAPDAFAKLRMVASSGRVLYKCKTRALAGSRNPMWRESFVFPVNKFQLPDVAVAVTVCAKRPVGRRDVIGSFCIGSSSSTGEEQEHWRDCLQAHGEQVCRWHRLQAGRR